MKQKSHRDTFDVSTAGRYIAIYKPFDVLSQFTPELPGQKTLSDFGLPANVYPVGRLDMDSEGLLILSDDPRLNKVLLDPERNHERIYLSQVERIPDGAALRQLSAGVVIQGYKTRPCRVTLLEKEPQLHEGAPVRFRKNVPTAWVVLALVEGKNRQVRKMTAAVGHPTLRLLRIAIGSLTLQSLKLAPGQWCDLTAQQVSQLFGAASLKCEI